MSPWRIGGAALGRVAALATRRPRWILAGWVLVAAVLNIVVPQLEAVVAHDTTPFLPASAPAVSAYDRMDDAFGSGHAKALSFLVVTEPGGVDTDYYRALVNRLEASNSHVADVSNWIDSPELRSALMSKDGEATYLPVTTRHPVGSPESDKDIAWLRDAAAVDRPDDASTYVTGDPAVVADLDSGLIHSIARITLVTIIIITLILLLLYRSWFTPLVPLATIGVSLLTARGVVALVGQHLFNVSTYTGTFLTALVLGAGTDYTVFLISRYHEALRAGQRTNDAIVTATQRIGAVIAASGATVIIGSACMIAAKLALFRTTGPAIAIAVFLTLLVSLTFTPALLAVAGDRAAPRGEARTQSSWWSRVGALVAAQPARVALVALIGLGALAALAPTMHPTYDTRALVPASTESDRGFKALDEHFADEELRPDYLLVESDHDLRNPRDLAVLDAAALAVTKVPGVDAVRSVTRPRGTVVRRAQLTYDVAQVGGQLTKASAKVGDGAKTTGRLASGATRLSTGAQRISRGTGRAGDAVDRFLAGLRAERRGLGAAGAGAASSRSGALALRDGAHDLATALSAMHDQTADGVHYLGVIYHALAADSLCTVDPVCNRSRAGLRNVWTVERDELLPGLATAADGAARIASGNSTLAHGLARLRTGLATAQHGVDRLASGERRFRAKLGDLTSGAHRLAAGAARIPSGVARIRSATQRLADGLDRAAGFLTTTARHVHAAGVSDFYLPAAALDNPRFALAKEYFVSSDGHTARFLVFGNQRESRIGEERGVVARALHGTPLADSAVYATGPVAITRDIHRMANADFRLVAAAVLIAVLLILVMLLRSAVAPLYLLASVVLSYAAAMGVTALIWQDLIGRPLDWTVPLLSFIVLVAVGADYNILLMSRVREESRNASREGVARAVAVTGGTITSAGLIFAGTFVAMIAAPMIGIAETGTAVAIGLLLDTFVVRSLLVPSVAALLGRWNWWPAR